MQVAPLDELRERSRSSLRERCARLTSKRFHLIQCAVAAAVAWWIAGDVLGHPTPFFAPIAAVVCLGTSYDQRLRRVVEVTLGVALGVLIGDLLVNWLGSGWWQVGLIVLLAMSSALLMDGGRVFVTQAAVQSIVITALVPEPGAAFTRWTDALIGGGVALIAATMVPGAPLRRPREQAGVVMRKVSELLRATAVVIRDGEVAQALELLADARGTDHLVRELRDAADEGLDVVASSPFRLRHRAGMRRMADLVEPLDRSLRSTRVLVRHVAVCAYHHRPIPPAYAELAIRVAEAADAVSDELVADRMAIAARPVLLAAAAASGGQERSDVLSAEVVLAQLRAIIADMLLLTGLDPLEATDSLPPV